MKRAHSNAPCGNTTLRDLGYRIVGSKRSLSAVTMTDHARNLATLVTHPLVPPDALSTLTITCLPLEVIAHIIDCSCISAPARSDARCPFHNDNHNDNHKRAPHNHNIDIDDDDVNNLDDAHVVDASFQHRWDVAMTALWHVSKHLRAACVVWAHTVRNVVLKGASNVHDINSIVHLPTLVRMCPNLRLLNLNNCGVGNAAVATIAHHCHSLDYLDVRWCFGVSDTGGLQLARGCPNLTHLYMTCCGVTDHTMIAIARNRTLTHVDVRFCPVTTKSAFELALKCNLVELHLCAFGSFRGRSDIPKLASMCPKLTRLSGRTTDADVADVAHFCRELTHLSISSSHHLTDEGVNALVRGSALIRHLDMRACDALTEDSIVHIATRYAPSLTYLDISECDDAVTATGVAAIANHCVNLLSLSMSECSNMDDDVLHVLSGKCVRLRELDIGLTNISDVGVVSFLAPLKTQPHASSADGRRVSMRKLNLWSCIRVTDDTLAVVAEMCPNLTDLDVRMCSNITDYGVVCIQSGCAHIRNFLTPDTSVHRIS